MGWLQPDSMWLVPSSFWQMGQIGGPSIWLHWAARFWLYIKSVRQSMTSFVPPEVTRKFSKWVTYVLLNDAFLIDQFLVFYVALCGLMVWDLFWLRTLYWTCMCAFIASKSEKIESLSAGNPDWHVLRVSGWQAGGRFFTLAGQKMDEWGWVSVPMWISWPLWFSAEHFVIASAHSFPRMPTWALTL